MTAFRGADMMTIYQRLMRAYGPQGWWPADSPFEVMVGAVLTQNTRWENVEMAIARLKDADMLDAGRIAACDDETLADCIRPAGFYRQKSRYLKVLARFCAEAGGAARLRRQPATLLRLRLLALTGIGPETADSILLYALDKPVFVVDAYTRRIFHRLGHLPARAGYDETQRHFHNRLPHSLPLFQEYHALIVAHAKRHCRARPACEGCPLQTACAHAARAGADALEPGRGAGCGDERPAQASAHVEQAAD